ncbi:ABC transporter ATP-binding protein [Ramlibacter sp.]|uniref:ABC transporter ATP-binding protein n=1 Tax=Ramlibacter sp. TaxID=1917967 RepID=UPI002FC7AEED
MSILHVKGVSKSFAGLKALNDVNLAVEEGSVHAIIGPNGAGKSTLLNCFVGRLAPDSGSVTFDGKSLVGLAPHEINQTGVARVFQTPEIFGDLSVLENVVIPALARRDGAFAFNAWPRADAQAEVLERAEHALEDVGLAGKRHAVSGNLSRGDKRRLELAMCLVQEPRLLLMDEPTAGMSRADTNNTIDLLQRVGEGKVTKVIIEHDMHVVFSLARRISVMAQGTVIAEGDPQAIKGDERVKQAYLGGAHL